MPALNFQAQFVQAVENGIAKMQGRPLPHPGVRPKTQTIRAFRKDGRDPKPGDALHLFTGMRTKACRKLGEVECTRIEFVTIDGTEGAYGIWDDVEVRVGNRPVEDADALARNDGFSNALGMLEWFRRTHGLPFEGQLTRWLE